MHVEKYVLDIIWHWKIGNIDIYMYVCMYVCMYSKNIVALNAQQGWLYL
jgi:hypothetical protein